MNLNIRPRKNTYTALTQPRQPRSRREARDNQSATLDTNTNINTPISKQTPIIEPENSNVTTSKYTARNIKTGVEIGFDNIRILSRTLRLTPIEINDVLDGVISSVRGWTIQYNSQYNTSKENNVILTQTSNNGSSVNITHDKNSQYNTQYNKINNVNITHTGGKQKIHILAINIATNREIEFESRSY